jgi:D-sedoheptulose 7-phosphate isomerase
MMLRPVKYLQPETTAVVPRESPNVEWIDEELSRSAALVAWLRDEERERQIITRLSRQLAECLARGGRILTCGNGGSMCDAMHCAEELSGRFRHDRPALSAMAIADPAHLTNVANDYGFDRVFARGVEAWGKTGDVLIVFTTSGRSPNIVAAAEAARLRGMAVVGLLGRTGGPVLPLCDSAVVVPADDSGRIQEVHIKIVHLVIDAVERLLFPLGTRTAS